MLTTYRQGPGSGTVWNDEQPLDESALWLDAFDPTDTERAALEKLAGAALPQREDMSVLGLGSRHHDQGRVLTLRARLYADDAGRRASPLGMLVTRERLITLRYAPCQALDDAVQRLQQSGEPAEGPDMLLMLMEAIANDVAERMQAIGADVADLSGEIFSADRERTGVLRDKLLRIGQVEAQLARYRPSLLGLGRVAGYVANRSPDWFDQDAVSGARVVVNDLKTLDEFEDQLTSKLSFLQDAVLGFISTDQNAVMKVLTVASVVTIPPVILAGIWGMNFKNMPELGWPHAYPMGLGVMLVSILVPLVWFGARGWLSRD